MFVGHLAVLLLTFNLVSNVPVSSPQGDAGSIWKPDSTILKQLTQKVTLGDYQFYLPANYSGGESKGLPPNLKSGGWKGVAKEGEQPGIVMFTISSNAVMEKEAKNNMRQALVNFSAGTLESMGVNITTRGKTETGTLTGIPFSRFAFTASTKNQLAVKGIVYGGIDNGKFVSFIVMGFEPIADTQNRWHESVVATLKRR